MRVSVRFTSKLGLLVSREPRAPPTPLRLFFFSLTSLTCAKRKGKDYWGALLFDNIMLDSHSQLVLGDAHPGDPSQSHLMTAFDRPKRQSFCSDPEGWGPLSPTGLHLTPCFLDAIVAAVAVWGILAGVAALWLLLKKRIPQPVSKNWHFYAKLVSYFKIFLSVVNRRLTDVSWLIGRACVSDHRHRSSSRAAS